jgi:hypothetical protein
MSMTEKFGLISPGYEPLSIVSQCKLLACSIADIILSPKANPCLISP